MSAGFGHGRVPPVSHFGFGERCGSWKLRAHFQLERPEGGGQRHLGVNDHTHLAARAARAHWRGPTGDGDLALAVLGLGAGSSTLDRLLLPLACVLGLRPCLGPATVYCDHHDEHDALFALEFSGTLPRIHQRGAPRHSVCGRSHADNPGGDTQDQPDGGSLRPLLAYRSFLGSPHGVVGVERPAQRGVHQFQSFACQESGTFCPAARVGQRPQE
mmetsp:Transcript_45014/g.119333  ORF Transcript_45014/g.119333 Transcript_45014/m.119333 type:complete len:215 (+) Transcript_45014:699-1343(+)